MSAPPWFDYQNGLKFHALQVGLGPADNEAEDRMVDHELSLCRGDFSRHLTGTFGTSRATSTAGFVR
jgi:hypothetical protein